MKKKDKKEELRKIPLKNYFILLIISVVTVFLTFYINAWIKVYKENKLSTSPLSENVNEVTFEELPTTLAETSKAIIYIGYNDNEEVYDMEKSLLKTIKKQGLQDLVIYVNVSNYLENNAYLKTIQSLFPQNKGEIIKAPMFLYYEDGQIKNVINSSAKVVNATEIIHIMDMYEIEN